MDRFEHEGKTYVAKDEVIWCKGCAFGIGYTCAAPDSAPPCWADDRDFIWVEEAK